MTARKTVFVGLSGGVDSSVAALRLKKQGYNTVGVFIKVWHPDFMVCNWEQERLDAMRVAAHLDIPFLTCDAKAAYRDEVATYFIEEYKAGRTPNPDVLCNQKVKFGAFLDFSLSHGADFVATGHYAQNKMINDTFELHRGVDKNKDQTYFLWSLSNKQLEKTLFPVGDTTKSEIRHEADLAGIPTASKKDSQGVCFLGQVDIPTFLSHYVALKPGKVLNERGEVIGEHVGALVYTIGQRHGFTIHTEEQNRLPMFVTGKNLTDNTITVSSHKLLLKTNDHVNVTNVTLRKKIAVGSTLQAQFRYRQSPFTIVIVELGTNQLSIQVLDNTVEQPAPGQSCVLYD